MGVPPEQSAWLSQTAPVEKSQGTLSRSWACLSGWEPLPWPCHSLTLQVLQIGSRSLASAPTHGIPQPVMVTRLFCLRFGVLAVEKANCIGPTIYSPTSTLPNQFIPTATNGMGSGCIYAGCLNEYYCNDFGICMLL